MLSKIINIFRAALCAVLITQLAGCGTIFYPERKGQHGGRIDAGVAVLDGVGLLLFIIPGVIAFAVDFGTGAIYLPGTSRSSLGVNNIKVVKFEPGRGTDKDIENIIKQETGLDVRLDQANLEVTRLKPEDDVRGRLSQAVLCMAHPR